MKTYIKRFAILLVTLVLTQTAFADVKIKLRQMMSGQTYENTTYIKGKRERAEQNTGGMQTVNITQCDLKRGIQIMPASQTYLINTWADAESAAPATTTSVTKSQTPGQQKKGGVVTTLYTIKDTGERKQMFGYTARHLIITMETESSPDACTPMKNKMQTDGWYIDAAFALDCETQRYSGYRGQNEKTGCQDRYEMKQNGTGKRGYPVYEKMTMFDEGGKETYSFINEVVELSNTTLDAALFEIPEGYREVKNSSELYASMSGRNLSSVNSSMSSMSSKNALTLPENDGDSDAESNRAPSQTQNSTAVLGAKKAGVIRIGLAGVKVGAVAENMNAEALARVMQNSFADYLKTPQVELVRLEAKLPSAIDAEAGQKECDYVVYSNVSYKKGGGGGFGMFSKVIAPAVGQVGIGHTGSTAGNIAGQVATRAIVTAGVLAGNVKSKDEISLDLKVQKTENGSPVLAKQLKVKAGSDGEDIITLIIEQASQAIASSVGRI